MAQMPSSNLFDYATSELSQDAFLAWLCAHADNGYADTKSDLHRMARSFIEWLHERSGKTAPAYEHVEIIQQHLKIDLLVRLYGERKPDQYLLIEDKTYTNDYSTQISGYLKALATEHKRAGQTWMIEPGSIMPIYLKTWVESTRVTDRTGQDATRIYLPDVVSFFSNERLVGVNSEILHSWCHARHTGYESLQRYKSKPMKEWDNNQWFGCFHDLTADARIQKLDPGYGHVNNAAGGFVGCWLAWKEKPGDLYIYLQIDAYAGYLPNATFRVGAKDGEKVTLDDCHRLLVTLQEGGRAMNPELVVAKPSRLKSGASSRFAEMKGHFMCMDERGVFEMERAVTDVLKCHELLDECANRLGFMQQATLA